MSRELRTRLEAAQGRVKSLRESLPSTNASPLPQDLAAIEALRSELSALETETATAVDRVALGRAERDEVARELLKLEPVSTMGNVGIPAAAAAGLGAGVALSWWWLTLPISVEWPRLAAAISLVASSVVLLRGAWWTGRVSGARGAR